MGMILYEVALASEDWVIRNSPAFKSRPKKSKETLIVWAIRDSRAIKSRPIIVNEILVVWAIRDSRAF